MIRNDYFRLIFNLFSGILQLSSVGKASFITRKSITQLTHLILATHKLNDNFITAMNRTNLQVMIVYPIQASLYSILK